MKQLKIGQTVRWTSQAGGKVTTKVGKVVKVVRAGQSAEEALTAHLKKNPHARASEFGSPRQETSYLVEVRQNPNSKMTKVYWPLAATLTTTNIVEQKVQATTGIRKAARKVKKAKAKR